jgi:hypothetical protein
MIPGSRPNRLSDHHFAASPWLKEITLRMNIINFRGIVNPVILLGMVGLRMIEEASGHTNSSRQRFALARIRYTRCTNPALRVQIMR